MLLSLHDDDVDFAAWCTYKYLNSGPGAVGQVFVHDRHGQRPGHACAWRAGGATTPRRGSGWRTRSSRAWARTAGARPTRRSCRWRPIAASLAIFDEVGLPACGHAPSGSRRIWRTWSRRWPRTRQVVTPGGSARARRDALDPAAAGARTVLEQMETRGIMADFREPDIIRLAPVPLYNSYLDIWRAATRPGGRPPDERAADASGITSVVATSTRSTAPGWTTSTPATGAVHARIAAGRCGGRGPGGRRPRATRSRAGRRRPPRSARGSWSRIADALERRPRAVRGRRRASTPASPWHWPGRLDIPRAVANLRFFATAILHTESSAYATDRACA